MTISYTHLSHTAGYVGGLTRLLFLWKGSLWKEIIPDFCLFFGLYSCLSVMYRMVLCEFEDRKIQYELFCVYCEKFSKTIPISFLLGFYVSQVVARWWAQFMSLPWPDTLARYLAVYMPGTDEISRNYRRTIIRWVNLGNVMALRLVSYKVMCRFPSYDHLVSSGLATARERLHLDKLNDLVEDRHQISWYPNMWAQNLLRKARKEGLILNDWFCHVLIKEVDNMANSNGMLICYGWINIPLVYTQVVTLAVYAYFVACLFGRQYLLPTQYKVEGGKYVPVAKFATISNWTGTITPGASNVIGYDNEVADFFIPAFTILEFLFYMGWLKVAETLLNPFGEDDDDFDTYYLIDRNLQISYIMADEAGVPIDPETDPFNESNAPELAHTILSSHMLDDQKPHMPTDSVKLNTDQVTLTKVRRPSQMNMSVSSKLNLAGNYLAVPANEMSSDNSRNRLSSITSQLSHQREMNGDSFGGLVQRPYMISHLLNKEQRGRTSNSSRTGQRTSIVLEEVPELCVQESPRTARPDTPGTPGTSSNERQLFDVNKKGDGGVGLPAAPPRLLPAGLLADGLLEMYTE